MTQTVFILGTDPQHCQELKDILQERIAGPIVTAADEAFPALLPPDSVVIATEEPATGVLYRRLFDRLSDQVRRARFLSELIRLFSSSLRNEAMIEQVVRKSTEVLGDTAFILMENDSHEIRMEAAHSLDLEYLVRILMTAVNLAPGGPARSALSGLLEKRQAVLIRNFGEIQLPDEMRAVVQKHSLSSLIAVPIQTKDYVLGAFVTLCSQPRIFSEEDKTLAIELSDFVAVALENAALVSELQRSAITDPLTGLYNTRFFNEALSREIARSERYTMPASLLMIDVDSFKLVNDSFGHVVGNKVLTQIGRTLERSVRNTDIVFRCGGDEFGVILPGTSLDGALHVASKIIEKIEAADILANLGYSGPVTVSIGASEHQRGAHFEAIVAEADQALYRCKEASKNCAKAFDRG